MGKDRKELNLYGYYISFKPTGVREIDEILAAVACAGKAYHYTQDWSEPCAPFRESVEGKSCVDWIQNAANRAAEKWNQK